MRQRGPSMNCGDEDPYSARQRPIWNAMEPVRRTSRLSPEVVYGFVPLTVLPRSS